tara:strand:+ start:176 stop:415 length:240 start_codon:yes stop_codon:yes gene_type:complete
MCGQVSLEIERARRTLKQTGAVTNKHKGLWIGGIQGAGIVDEAKEAFLQMIKMAILFGGMAVFYIWLEKKVIKKWIKRK